MGLDKQRHRGKTKEDYERLQVNLAQRETQTQRERAGRGGERGREGEREKLRGER